LGSVEGSIFLSSGDRISDLGWDHTAAVDRQEIRMKTKDANLFSEKLTASLPLQKPRVSAWLLSAIVIFDRRTFTNPPPKFYQRCLLRVQVFVKNAYVHNSATNSAKHRASE